jgi:hypothetical protein
LKKRQSGIFLAAVAFLVLWMVGTVWAASVSSGKGAGGTERGPRFLLELKREATNRGTPEETSKSQIKIDAFFDGVVSLLRLQVPFPDDKTSFEGDPFSPRLGDIKVRGGFRSVRVYDIPVGSFLEVTFPTADPKKLGSGKYQVSPGMQANFPISFGQRLPESHKISFNPSIRQVFSVAGDEDRKDINYTKFEISLRDTWRQKYWLKLTPKLIMDWEQNAKTGAVAELEGGWMINRNWRVWLMFGTRLWGEGIPSTYDKRVGINTSVAF